ncbi:MAG: mechanosensitive ion channel family protein [Acidobacteria bacterium]|nr:mechanosensitive ion channel family protein [Acidobacteriota bacterium]
MSFALLQTPPNLINWAQSAAVFGIVFGIFFLLRHLMLRSLSRWDSAPDSVSKILHDTLRIPSFLWTIAGSLSVTLETSDLPTSAIRWVAGGSMTFLVLSICVVASNLIVRLANLNARKRGLTFGLSGVSHALVHVFVLLLGATVLLRYFNFDVKPLLTALGVGGLAVALALRDTLANFFAGIHILAEAPLSVGDFIRLSSGEEGTVTDIGWRTTRVLTSNNNVIVIPNEKITSSILTNYALPDARVVIEVHIYAAHHADFEKIRQVAIEEAVQVQDVLPDFTPLVVLDPGILPTHLHCKLIVQVPHRLKQGPVQSDLRIRLLDRFRKEGIPLPAIEQVATFKP